MATIVERKIDKSKCQHKALNATSVLNSVAAGYIAGISGVVVGHPFESVKVWLQTRTENQNKYLKLANTSNTHHNATTTTTHNTTASGLPVSARSTTASAKRKASSIKATKHMSTSTHKQQELYYRKLLEVYQNKAATTRNQLRALYSGVTGPFVTVGLVQCINFAIYDSVRRVLHDRDTKHDRQGRKSSKDYLTNDSLTNVALAGATAGGVLSLFTGPMIKVKIQQQVTGNGLRQAVNDTFFHEGRKLVSPQVLFRGFTPHVVMETIGRALYFTTYEGMKRTMVARRYNDNNMHGNPDVTLAERMISAATAGITSWAIFFPLDAVRSRLYAQHQSKNFKTCWEMACIMYYEKSPSGSLRSFYRGFGVTVIRAGPVAAAVLPIYDLSLKWLSSSSN